MRKLTLFLCWGLLSLACSPIDLAPNHGVKDVEICFTASFENIATKTERQENDGTGNYPVYWCPGDAVSLFFNQGDQGGSRFVAQNTTKVEKATFKGTITGFAGGGEQTGGEFWFWGVYPYSEDNSCDGSSVTITLPEKQTAKAGSFSDGLWPTMARSKGLELSFYNICGGVKFSVSRNDITAVKFRGNSNESLAGTARIEWDKSGHPVVKEHLSGKPEITISAPGGGTFEPGESYYIVFYPELLSKGFTLTYVTSGAKQGVLSSSASRQFNRGLFVPAIDLDSHVNTWTDVENPSGQETSGTEGGSESGLYFGLSTFDRHYKYYPVRLLSEESLDTYKSSIDGLQLTNDNGTLLYYSFDEDITAMQGITLPSDLSTVSIVTFTDGFDEGSTNFHIDLYDTDDEYLDYVSDRMDNETIRGVPIKSYAIGLKGTDANSDITSFRYCLNKLASSPADQYVYEIDANEFSQLRQAFSKIAEDLSESIRLYNVSVHFTPPSNEGLIRITFDIDDPEKKNASSSNFYIEGIYSRSDWLLHDVTYHGFSANPGDVVHMTNYDGWEVFFDFEGLQPVSADTEIVNSNIYTWKYNANTSTWRVNTESTSGGGPSVKVVNSSALVLLNLDLSHSLEGRLPDLKNYSKEFIESLYTSSIDPNEIKTVHLNKTELNLIVGQSETLIASVSPSTASTSGLRWSSAIPSVATVDQNGQVTAVSEGTTIISVSSEDGKELATCAVHVSFQHVESMSLNYTEQTLYVGKSVTLVATVSPSDASDKTVTWTSSSPSIASVSSSGEVTGVANGSATITATTTDGGKTATCSVTVADYAPSTTPIDLSLAVTIKETGTRGYIAQSELQFADMSKYEPFGLTVLSGTGDFIIALEDASSTGMVHSAAAKFYYLPTYDQGITISARFTDINKAFECFGGDKLVSSSKGYWTSKQDGSNYYYINGPGGNLYSNTGERQIREVINVDNTEVTSYVTKSVGVYYTYKTGEDRFFVSKVEDIPEGCAPEGLAIKSSTGCGNVILSFENASSDGMTWTSAAAVYGSSNFPSKEQGELISARFYEVNAALQRFGNVLGGSTYYWTSQADSGSQQYTIWGSGGQLYSRSRSEARYVRLVLGTF